MNKIYDTCEEAVSEANGQLSSMTEGNIYLINDSNVDFMGRLILDHNMGNILYWELSEEETIAYLDAYTGEILYYDHTGCTMGTLTQQEIETRAEIIAEQFAALPSDISQVNSELIESYSTVKYDAENNETLLTEYYYWYIDYNRMKDGIITEDHLRLLLNRNGDLQTYYRIWNMALNELDTTCAVTKTEAENTAHQAAGQNSTVHESSKMIVRPNCFWDDEIEGFTYGEAPMIVWVVYVEDWQKNQLIYHINGKINTIVGGNIITYYYEEG